ncbi:MAG: tryptophan--tRNA ligase [Cellulomonadaceae bacterium]|nr:tryptophan--tRNA ligase [Cellulomonadaceae bacterium]
MAGPRRILSGMQPTSDSLHLGNYIGAARQWVELQQNFEALFFVADLHALTVNPDPALLRERTRRTAAQYLAAGIDPSKSILFVQSQVPQHAELGWLLQCQTGFGEASRMTQFKDKSARLAAGEAAGGGPTVGLFAYPMLMAADILLYDSAYVPVGEDQRQHLELTRDIAERLNARFGAGTAVVPKPYIQKETAKIQDLQNPAAKMSKSSSGGRGVVWLLEPPKAAIKAIKAAVTDADPDYRVFYDPETKPGISNLLSIFSAVTGLPIADIAAEYDGRGYGYLKVDLAQAVSSFLIPFQERANMYLSDPVQLDAILADGAARAAAIAEPVLERIYDRFGLLRPNYGRLNVPAPGLATLDGGAGIVG